MNKDGKADRNEIIVSSTGYKPSVLRLGVLCDVEEYWIFDSNVDEEKGELIYDINLSARRLSIQGGLEVSASSRNSHINNLQFVTELELKLMRERGVTVTIVP